MDLGLRHAAKGGTASIFVRVFEEGESLRVAVFGIAPKNVVPAENYLERIRPMLEKNDWTGLNRGEIVAAAEVGAGDNGETSPYLCFLGQIHYRHGHESYGRGELKGRQSWLFPVHLPTANSPIIAPGEPYNKYTVGALTKDHAGSDMRRAQHATYLQLMAPYAGAPLAECVLSLVYNEGYGYWSNKPYKHVKTLQEVMTGFLMTFMPKLVLSGPATVKAGAVLTATCQIVDPVTGQPLTDKRFHREDIHVEATAGYVPQRRIIPSPSAQIRLRALDLEPGEQIKLKVGWSNYSGAAELPITVT